MVKGVKTPVLARRHWYWQYLHWDSAKEKSIIDTDNLDGHVSVNGLHISASISNHTKHRGCNILLALKNVIQLRSPR